MGAVSGALFFVLGPRNLTRYSGDPSENKTTRHGVRGPRIGDQFPRITAGGSRTAGIGSGRGGSCAGADGTFRIERGRRAVAGLTLK